MEKSEPKRGAKRKRKGERAFLVKDIPPHSLVAGEVTFGEGKLHRLRIQRSE
jgi:hypothetical protein